MSYILDGVISQEEIRDMFVDYLEAELVASNVFPTSSILGAESIKIPGLGTVPVNDYNGSTPTATDQTDTSVILTLDQAKYFLQRIDKVDDAQAAIKILAKVLAAGAYEIANAVDEFAFGEASNTTNTITAAALDETNVAKWIGDFGVKLSTLKAPKMGRKLIVSPEVSAVIARANLNLQTTSAEEAAREGFVGRFGGFDIFESLNLKDGAGAGEKTCIATVGDSLVIGVGYQEFGAGSKADDFKDYAKGLVNFGAKIIQSAYIVSGDASVA